MSKEKVIRSVKLSSDVDSDDDTTQMEETKEKVAMWLAHDGKDKVFLANQDQKLEETFKKKLQLDGSEMVPKEERKAKRPQDEQEIDMDKWNPMVDEFNAVTNTYKETNNFQQIKEKEPVQLCKFYKAGKKCYRGEACPNLHIESTDDRYAVDSNDCLLTAHQSLDLPDVLSHVVLQVSCIETPQKFFAVLPRGNIDIAQVEDDIAMKEIEKQHQEKIFDNLVEMTDRMKEIYERKKTRSYQKGTDLYCGEIVAVKHEGQWYRSRIIDTTYISGDADSDSGLDFMRESGSGHLLVHLVDFGNNVRVQHKDVRQILPQFLVLPFQAMDCSLHNLQPVGRGVGRNGRWSSEAVERFYQLTVDKTLVAKICAYDMEDRCEVELYNVDDEVNIGKELVKEGYARYYTNSA